MREMAVSRRRARMQRCTAARQRRGAPLLPHCCGATRKRASISRMCLVASRRNIVMAEEADICGSTSSLGSLRLNNTKMCSAARPAFAAA